MRDGTIYTADLYIPEMNLHCELKPNTLTIAEMRKCEAVSRMGYNIVAIVGRPFVPYTESRSPQGHTSAYEVWTYHDGKCVSADGVFGYDGALFIFHMTESSETAWCHPDLMRAYAKVLGVTEHSKPVYTGYSRD